MPNRMHTCCFLAYAVKVFRYYDCYRMRVSLWTSWLICLNVCSCIVHLRPTFCIQFNSTRHPVILQLNNASFEASPAALERRITQFRVYTYTGLWIFMYTFPPLQTKRAHYEWRRCIDMTGWLAYRIIKNKLTSTFIDLVMCDKDVSKWIFMIFLYCMLSKSIVLSQSWNLYFFEMAVCARHSDILHL